MALKVFDLQCDQGHLFEGWFSSHEDYDAQQARGLLTCPVCDSANITKKLSAPHLNVSHLREPSSQANAVAANPPAAAPARSTETAVASADHEAIARIQAAVLQEMRRIIRNTEDVGPAFAEEARRIQSGEADERPIRGTATAEERAALTEEGIEIMALPDFLNDDRLQ
ncbi:MULTISPECIES: DUF1178 family protein [unclassified Bordetella]|uniref:DUF1178 family protein n=1 Tax=unclassified Bordetella TaxID=2630031 RepID=UPI00132994B4|nr:MULTISPECIES: DUF1178 family protein [unclassified Bordetella]MVW70576.1 DUF1178 family protein [Bordetella sp. 15P40C-2]MVW79784.1 DUF1178 family protein [Bordetella sp. 02P26C-1]